MLEKTAASEKPTMGPKTASTVLWGICLFPAH